MIFGTREFNASGSRRSLEPWPSPFLLARKVCATLHYSFHLAASCLPCPLPDLHGQAATAVGLLSINKKSGSQRTRESMGMWTSSCLLAQVVETSMSSGRHEWAKSDHSCWLKIFSSLSGDMNLTVVLPGCLKARRKAD